MKQPADSNEIHEGKGRLPWWVWVAIAAWLVYAFILGPFNWFPPQG